jgi:hypothetical protein
MARTAQSSAFNNILAADGFESRFLLIVTLQTGATVYLSDAPCTIGTQAYEPDIRDPGELRFSQGGNIDGIRISLENVSGIYGATDETGASPLEGATAIAKYAVSEPGANNWQVDTLSEGRIRSVQEVTQELAPFTLVSDINDPMNLVSGAEVTLTPLTPTATTSTVNPTGNGTGWPPGGHVDWLRDRRFDRDYLL